ncbi:hypothetical protein ACWCV9_04520 [Streptomyces sp. NPDC001606]
MTFEEQWASARTHAAAKPSPPDAADMTLASADSGSGGGGGALVYLRYPWTNGATILGELRTTTNSSVTQLTEAKAGETARIEGLASIQALSTVRDSWHRRLTAVRDECEHLEPAMRQAAKDHGENEARIKAAIEAEKNLSKRFEADH